MMKVSILFLFGLVLLACSEPEPIANIGGNQADSQVVDQEEIEAIISLTEDTISVCSFNIQFLGSFKNRENDELSQVLKDYDVVVIQEMVSPPCDGIYPDETTYSADKESREFVEEMEELGFKYWLSEEDTGPKKNHTNSTGSEWWIAFYRSEKVVPDSSRFYGFLEEDHTLNANYDRVPFAFPFKSTSSETNFTLISVHLKPGNGTAERARRQHELKSLFSWVEGQPEDNKDFITLGDCNIYKLEEFEHFELEDTYSLNRHCASTNTKLYELASKGKPYDHVFYRSASKEDIIEESFEVVDLNEVVKAFYLDSFPFEPYEHNFFRTRLSDHVPISFSILTGKDSD